ncbi:MAG: hypothetical protein DI539_05870 [Flavobacterium psychrophilum]|nr:MAG: hypothetical protein DI539_05870 [Flavobacterium psychrophilum]
MDRAISSLSHLDTHYVNMPTVKKRELIGSIFPEKIVFDGKDYRTPRVNEAARLIYMINSDLYSIKKPERTQICVPFRSSGIAGNRTLFEIGCKSYMFPMVIKKLHRT